MEKKDTDISKTETNLYCCGIKTWRTFEADIQSYGRLREEINFEKVFRRNGIDNGGYYRAMIFINLFIGITFGFCMASLDILFKQPEFYYLEKNIKKYQNDMKKICENESKYKLEFRVENLTTKFGLFCDKRILRLATLVFILILCGLISFTMLRFCDKKSRILMMRISLFVAPLAFAFASCMQSYPNIVIWLGIGYSFVISFGVISVVYLNENLYGKKIRILSNIFMIVCVNIGSIVCSFVSEYLVRDFRLILGINGSLILVNLFSNFYLLKSHKLLYDKKNPQELANTLLTLQFRSSKDPKFFENLEEFEFSRKTSDITIKGGDGEDDQKAFSREQEKFLDEIFYPYRYGTILISVADSDFQDQSTRNKFRASISFENFNQNVVRLILVCLFFGNSCFIYQATGYEDIQILDFLLEKEDQFLPVFRIFDILVFFVLFKKIFEFETTNFLMKSFAIFSLIGVLLILTSPLVTKIIFKVDQIPLWLVIIKFLLSNILTRTICLCSFPLLFEFSNQIFPTLVKGKVFSYITIIVHCLLLLNMAIKEVSEAAELDYLGLCLSFSLVIVTVYSILGCFEKRKWVFSGQDDEGYTRIEK